MMHDPKHHKATSEHIKDRARALRRDATLPERSLWGLLRDRRLSGFKFRRQHVVGPYIVDFYCPADHLVIELDGRSHDDRATTDREREAYLKNREGLRVLRIANDDVLDDPEAVLVAVLRALGKV
jgi:very-short-patch-repair endonuclease